jgi:DNA-binding NarL/FixJ family response regulator
MIRVLVADDHTIIRDGLKQILADTPDLVVAGEAANGNEALEQVRDGTWDVLVLDVSMPGRSGLDLIKQIRKEKPRLPILVFSMHQEEQYAARALRAGASGYLTKEADGTQLVEVIRKVARGGVYVSSHMAEQMARGLITGNEGAPHATLSDREYQIFRKIVAGRLISDIADELCLSVKTVSTYRSRVLEKMNFRTNADITSYALRNGLIQ